MAQKGRPRKTKEPVVEEKITQTTDNTPKSIFTDEERLELNRILKLVKMDHNDMESIFSLYKKFINPRHKGYNIGCKCQNNISKLKDKLIEFYVTKR